METPDTPDQQPQTVVVSLGFVEAAMALASYVSAELCSDWTDKGCPSKHLFLEACSVDLESGYLDFPEG